jgi:hypothetical protein
VAKKRIAHLVVIALAGQKEKLVKGTVQSRKYRSILIFWIGKYK